MLGTNEVEIDRGVGMILNWTTCVVADHPPSISPVEDNYSTNSIALICCS